MSYPEHFTVAEAADYCRVHEKTIRTWMRERGLRCIKPTPTQQGRVLIRRGDLDAFLDAHSYQWPSGSA
jgi:excisionase family DNA binding protein